MRLKRNRVKEFLVFPRITEKDAEGGTVETYGPPYTVKGIQWPTNAETQQRLYGAVYDDARSVKVDGSYHEFFEGGKTVFYVQDAKVTVLDGVSFDLSDDKPRYEIGNIQPYSHLEMGVTRLDRRVK